MKKSTALILMLILFLLGLFWCAVPRETLIGRWESCRGLKLEVTTDHMIVQGISFPYVVQKDGRFLLDGGRLGPILGSYRFEGDRLHLTIRGCEELFFRA